MDWLMLGGPSFYITSGLPRNIILTLSPLISPSTVLIMPDALACQLIHSVSFIKACTFLGGLSHCTGYPAHLGGGWFTIKWGKYYMDQVIKQQRDSHTHFYHQDWQHLGPKHMQFDSDYSRVWAKKEVISVCTYALYIYTLVGITMTVPVTKLKKR